MMAYRYFVNTCSDRIYKIILKKFNVYQPAPSDKQKLLLRFVKVKFNRF